MQTKTVNGFLVPVNFEASIANFRTRKQASGDLAKRKGKANNNGKKQ